MLWALFKGKPSCSIVTIILHDQVVVIVVIGVHWCARQGLNWCGFLTLHVSNKAWCIWKASAIVYGTVLIGTANPSIILVGGVIIKHKWSEVVSVLCTVGILIDIIIYKPH